MDNSLRTNIDKIYGKEKGIKIDNDDKVNKLFGITYQLAEWPVVLQFPLQ